ncbi:MAG TPA: hypothetical protein PLD88_04995, partial [Candidatus Berkiella sp.]|nr:hypothetical protein [Candidatus Berkiella sp.]
AGDAHSAVCPIALEGTRHIMRGDTPLLTPKRIKVMVGEKCYPESGEWKEVMRLHNQAREVIAEYCGEPSIDY